MSENLLSVRGLKTYLYTFRGILKAVDGVDLEVNRKASVGLVGESGCGKTMTALSIIGLVPPPGKVIEGKIIYKNKNLSELSGNEMRKMRGKEISMVFQDPMTFLNPVMRIKGQIAETIQLHMHCTKKEAEKRAIEVLSEVSIPSPSKVAEYYPHQLSGGMRQRVIISSALSCNPSLLIGDEPTSALDVSVQAQILDLIKQLTRRLGTSLLLITHDLGIVADICDTVYVMYAGKIVEHANVFRLFENPAHPYTKGLLDSVLSIDQSRKPRVFIDGVVPDLVNPPVGCRFRTRCKQCNVAVCGKEDPPKVEIERDHEVSCWLYHEK